MKVLVRCIACCAALAACSVTAQVSSQPAATLRQAIDAAWERSVDNAAAAGRVGRAQAELAIAAAPWAAPPSLEAGVRQGGSARESDVGVAWPLWLPGQRAARAGAADAELTASQQAVRAARHRLAGEVREAALDLLASDAELHDAQSQVQALQGLADDVDRRVAAGDLARADAMASRAELLAGTNALAQARQRLRESRTRWFALTGLQEPPAWTAWQEPSAGAAPDHPELLLAHAAVESARRRVDALEHSRRDPPEVAVRYRREAGSLGAGDVDSIGLSLRIPMATASRNQPLLATALAELEQARVREQRLRERLALEGDAARDALAAASQQLEAEQRRASLLRERANLLDRSFRAGETGLPETLRALALALQAEAGVLRRQAAVQQAQGRLDQLLGRQP